jgi:hypothetical protein
MDPAQEAHEGPGEGPRLVVGGMFLGVGQRVTNSLRRAGPKVV